MGKVWGSVAVVVFLFTGTLAGPEAWAVQPSKIVTLEDLGYQKGSLIEAAAANQTFFFPVPLDLKISSALLQLRYNASPELNRHAFFRIYINDMPRRTISLQGTREQQVLNLPLQAGDLNQRFIKIRIKSSLPVTDNRCLDDRITAGYLHFLANSGVRYRFTNGPKTIRAAWELLPRKVRVSIPAGKLDEEVFNAALLMGQALEASGKKVQFTTLPVLGEIVIAPKSALAAMGAKVVGNKQLGEGINAALMIMKKRNVIVITDPFSGSNIFFEQPWIGLASASRYQVYAATSKLKEGKSDRYAISLSDLGLDIKNSEMYRRIEWGIAVSSDQFPAGYFPDTMLLQVVSAPSESETPVILYLYLNDVLQEVVRLNNDGKRQKVSVRLNRTDLRRHNRIRLLAQRKVIEGNCEGDPERFPIQIHPDSSLQAVSDETLPASMADLANYLRKGVDIYLPKDYLSRPVSVLGLLSRMGANFSLPLDVKKIHYFDEDAEVTPAGPFVLIGNAKSTFKNPPVRFDQGHIRVIDKRGQVLLEASELPGITVGQVVQTDRYYGLWLTPWSLTALPRLDDMYSSDGDVVFADSTGVLLTLHSDKPGLARIVYADAQNWFDVIGRYRFWFFALGWLVLTVLIVHLYRQARRHKTLGSWLG